MSRHHQAGNTLQQIRPVEWLLLATWGIDLITLLKTFDMNAATSYVLRFLMIVLLLGCLARMPYGYYQVVRLGMTVMCFVLAYYEYEQRRTFLVITCIALALLFNPPIKVYFTRAIWNAIDVAVAAFVAVWVGVDFMKGKTDQTSKN